MVGATIAVAWALLLVRACFAAGPFLKELDASTWVIGNDYWNLTQGRQYATKLYYKEHDCVGDAWGHYVSYNGAQSDLNWTSADIYQRTAEYIDVRFNATEGEMHWVIYADLAGAYQYFVNRALPVLGEFRTLWRLDNTTFPNARTNEKDGPLPDLTLYANATKVQDETWQLSSGEYLTKYDWTTFLRDVDYYGVYGDEFGSWYINPGKDYFNGDHLKQELIVHRESATGDAVQLNMLHGTHFQASSSDAFADGKLWGPWLWYLNNGSKPDAAARQAQEFASWPYSWFSHPGYQARARRIRGTLRLSDGRPAAGAAVFLGDSNPNTSTLDMGRGSYYTAYADAGGAFAFEHVRAGTYGLQAWANGGAVIGDVAGAYVRNSSVVVVAGGSEGAESSAADVDGAEIELGTLTWRVPGGRERLFLLGDFDRKALGFKHGGAARAHGLVERCPANLTFVVGRSAADSDWCFGQSAPGAWEITFFVGDGGGNNTANGTGTAIASNSARKALLTVSLAGYSSGTTAGVFVNGARVGNLTDIASDPSLYRSATAAGEWHLFEFEVAGGVLREGWNRVAFVVEKSSRWRGFLWDAVGLEWV
ncbi:polysaccharide lyase family 4 protein [Aplosporella prunicola CBS 121167]|uniref:rhamnogalacturonan endolyase n=1 Tax=Aplosporella prunicola CBS 121167 TaxID=1176127 RepID=A0A6A6B835_9PEZI|nr:polysaccharide lyase family 4 protein [Aplosporella prunicola CBS 121167]KAF2138951.1 polysaccharide lyase family 4 protein [Aplosporella prunicola CBS 121167]